MCNCTCLDEDSIHTLRHTDRGKAVDTAKANNIAKNQQACRYYGRGHLCGAPKCPAFGKRCTNCNGKNHFARLCQKQPNVRTCEVSGQLQPGLDVAIMTTISDGIEDADMNSLHQLFARIISPPGTSIQSLSRSRLTAARCLT